MRNRTTFELAARLGYAARGVVYLIIGAFAVVAALSSGDRPTGKKGALQALLDEPFGEVLLGIVALGLLGFALWRVLQAFLDVDHYGREPKALVRRTAYAVSAAVYAALAFWAVKAAFGSGEQAGSGDQSARDWTAYLMAEPFGQWLVGAVGAIIVATGIAIGVRGWKGTFERRLGLSRAARRWVMPMGRFGFLARAVVFLLIGAFLILAAVHANSAEAKGLAGALAALQRQPYGWVLLGITALGLFAFGAFQFVMAAFRRIDAPDGDEAARKVRASIEDAARGAGQMASRVDRVLNRR